MVVLFAGGKGYLDGIATSDVRRFEADLLREMHDNHADVMETIQTEKALSDQTEAKLREILDGFTKTFA